MSAPSEAPPPFIGPTRARAGLFASVGVAALGLMLWTLPQAGALRQSWPEEIDRLYIPSAQTLSFLSLGHNELMADLVAARTNVYFGDQIASKGAQKWLSFYLNTVADLDPHFSPIYHRGAVMLFYNGATPTLERIQAANALLARGLEIYPDDWELWFQLGFNQAFELKGVAPDHPDLEMWQREGTEALRMSTYFDGVPPHVPTLVATMLTKQGERELALEHLRRTFAVTSDPEAREQIRRKIISLAGQSNNAELESDLRTLLRQSYERYPYAPEAFSIIAGTRRSPAVDLSALGRPENPENEGRAPSSM